jgi:uncharacterized protein (TIGR03000 family)
MTRPLAALALLALPVVASAQDITVLPSGATVIVGPPMIGGVVVNPTPITNGASALYRVPDIRNPSRQVWLPSGSWGGVSYSWPVREVIVLPAPVPVAVPTARLPEAAPRVAASGEASATLVVQFPATAEVWVGGKKAAGDPAAEWTLTSPALTPGEAHTFEVKGRWRIGGTTFETERLVTVPAGERSRSLVVSGTEAK